MFRVKDDKEKKDKKPKTKQQKWAIGLGIALAVLFVITIGARLAISPESPLYNSYLMAIMPKSIDTVFDEKEMTLYIEKNKEFDKEKNQPLEAFSVYYYENNDKSKEKTYIEYGKKFEGENESAALMTLQFLGNATITDGIIRTTIKDTLIVLCILLGCYLIFIWYIIWSINYDKKKELNKE